VASTTERDAMRRAIALSAFGLGTTSPNPPVGCVILSAGGQIVGEGYHRRKGEPHAEVNALAAAGERATAGTAVVTLEPCNHYGRTPPCHQALIDAGITRTVVALIDPTSRGKGGVARLRQAGMDVEVDVLADEALLVLGPWLAALQAQRPLVIWPYVMRRTGVIEPALAVFEDGHLLTSVDVVLHQDGTVREAVPDSHGTGVLELRPADLHAGPHVVLSDLYKGGVRSVVLDGGLSMVAAFLAGGLVDRVVAYLSPEGASVHPILNGTSDLLLMPSGFRLSRVDRFRQHIRLTGEFDSQLWEH
jgi:diaminohydroxyphosphoribosylaminopyrimidine deaminase/5-amino-6-(5-phosphoribosylamino)uracil reductase